MAKSGGVSTQGTGTIACPQCLASLQLVEELRLAYSEERQARIDAEERHRTERDAWINRVLSAERPQPAAPSNRIYDRVTAEGPRPVQAPISSQPVDLASRIERMRFQGAAVLGRAPAPVEPPPDAAAEEAADVEAQEAVVGAATAKE